MSIDLVKYEDAKGGLVSFTAQEVKDRLCPGIDDKELALVMGLCQAQHLNPFTRDVYIIKYGSAPASIVTGKEVFTKRAASNPDYEGMDAGVTVLRDGVIERREGSAVFKAAGEQLVGGWARVYVKGRRPQFEEVTLDEYSTGKSGWAKMPATMIRKVALVHALREAFPDDFQGLYCQEEMAKAGDEVAKIEAVEDAPAPQDAVVEVAASGAMMTDAQERAIDDLRSKLAELKGCTIVTVMNAVRESKTMEEAGWDGELISMTEAQAAAAIGLLNNWIEKTREAAQAAVEAADEPIYEDEDIEF